MTDELPRQNQARARRFILPCLMVAVGGLLAIGVSRQFLHGQQLAFTDSPLPPQAQLFNSWPKNRKPDVVLVLTGQQFGYIQPCGCSKPQKGGLERRFNFISQLRKQRDWTVVPIDLGDVAQPSGPQAKLKYVYSMKALHAIGYAAVGVGRTEMALSLLEALAEYSLNNPDPPVLFSNLKNPGDFANLTHTDVIHDAGNVKIGILSVVANGKGAKPLPDPSVKLDSALKSLSRLLPAIAKHKPDLLVLLFHGDAAQAKKCAARFPQLNVILCSTTEEEPPGNPAMVGKTMIVDIGHKGRYVGCVGAYRTGQAAKPFDLHYQLVPMLEEYETPPGKDATNPVLAILEQYTRQVKDQNLLANYTKTAHPIQLAFPGATYVGSEKCKSCHHEAYKIWKKSPHSHAFAELVTAKRPSLRQFDGECVKCHVVGFEHLSGYTNMTATPKLENNGCENCHGPCSIHVDKKNPNWNNPRLLKLMNPYATPIKETPAQRKVRLLNLDTSCQKCHDIDNDVHWNFPKKWDKIKH
jgi:hypothetical protein